MNVNKWIKENQKLIDVMKSPSCLYLLHLIGLHPGITLNQIKKDYNFKSETAEAWLKRLFDIDLIEIKNSKYYLTQYAKNRLKITNH